MMDIEGFYKQMSEQKDAYKSLLELSRRQIEFVKSKDVDGFIKTADERKTVLDKIDAMEIPLKPLKQEYVANKASVPKEFADRMNAVVDELMMIISQSIAMEEQIIAGAQELMKSAGGGTQKVQQIQTNLSKFTQKKSGSTLDTNQ